MEVLRTGEPMNWSSAPASGDWADRLDDVDFAREITAAMDARGTLLAPDMAHALADVSGRRLLDIAGGSGMYGTALIDARPQLRATILERVPAAVVARALLADWGYTDRVTVESGDMFEELPDGHDLHLLSHTVHDWGRGCSPTHPRHLVRSTHPGWLARRPRRPHQRRQDRTASDRPLLGPAHHSTQGQYWAMPELEVFLREAGFTNVTERPAGPDRSLVLARALSEDDGKRHLIHPSLVL